MDKFTVYVPKLLPKDERFRSGRRSCKGCGKALSARLTTKALKGTASFPDALTSQSPPTDLTLGGYSCAHDEISSENVITDLLSQVEAVNRDTAAANRSSHALVKKAVVAIDRRVLMSEFLDLSLALEHKQPALYLCFDNDLHMDAFLWRSAPRAFILNEEFHPSTATDVAELVQNKNCPSVVAEADFSYFATACPAFPFDLVAKVKKGLEVPGNAFILVLAPCPTGWNFPAAQSAVIGTSAVQTGYFPLYEIEGDAVTITEPGTKLRPLPEFLSKQKRFMIFPPALIPALQEAVNTFYSDLVKKSKGT